MKKILLIINSDIGTVGAIGIRTKYILDAMSTTMQKKTTVFCRDFAQEKTLYTCKKIVNSFVMKSLTAIPIYVSDAFPARNIKNYIFDLACLAQVKRLNLSEYSCVHTWEYLPKTLQYIKKHHPTIKIIADMPMALTNILQQIPNPHVFSKTDLQVPAYFQKSLPFIDEFIVPSVFVKKSIELLHNRSPIHIIPFGVDTNKFLPNKNGKNQKIKDLSFCFAGNVNVRKGIPELLLAWKELKDDKVLSAKCRLNIYGRVYPQVKRLFTNCEQLNIHLHGFVKIEKHLPHNDVFIFPTLLEGSAKSVYEAMACGLCVITTENAGSIIKNGVDGLIVPVQNVQALKNAIKQSLNKEFRERIQTNALKIVTQYTWELYAKTVIKYYKA